MKILIAVPTFETIYPDTFKSIWDVDKAGCDVEFEFVRGYDVATARNKIADITLKRDADYVLMVDNDVVLPKDLLSIMLGEETDIVLGYYAHRDTDNIYRGKTCICKRYQEDGTEYYNYPLESEYTAEEMKELREAGEWRVRIHGGGMGCAFIRSDLFRKLSYPWYDWVNYPGTNRGMLSEDLYFCEKCKAAGVPIYADTRASCGHLLRHVQWAV